MNKKNTINKEPIYKVTHEFNQNMTKNERNALFLAAFKTYYDEKSTKIDKSAC